DGVGYAILGASIAEDGDYREIDKPDRPRHAHFPPGYPLVLAGVWTLAGRSEPAAHAVSIVATVLAVLLSWRWFRSLYPPLAALGLSLALALNWTWTRLGGDIASEPVYQFWQMLALVLAGQVGRKGGMAGAGALGGALGMATLTRYVGAPLAAAITIDLALRSRFREAVVSTLVASFMFLPWLIWMLRAGPSSHLGLLPEATSLLSTIAHQSLFYLQRIPDQIVGPFVEVGTIYRRSMPVLIAVHVWAVLTTGLILTGWIISLSRPGAVLSGLVRVPLVVRDQCSRRTGRGRPVAPRNMPLQRGGNRGTRRIVALWSLGTLALLLVWPFTEAGRFLVPLVPALLVGAVEGLSTVLARLGFRRQARRVAVALVLLVSVPYSVHAVASHRP
ncbi:MAG TPA: glycosyltransferase family 39 protein, partial [Isosphaeraceae bacterium]|nr:glycosyltransferase family 39 protein [Isosphaeraceae bacterium]